jgi:hypothetical protein
MVGVRQTQEGKYRWLNVQYAIRAKENENARPMTHLFAVYVAANHATLINVQVVLFIKAIHMTGITAKFPSTEFAKCLIQWNFRIFQM